MTGLLSSVSGGLTESFAGTAGDDWRSASGRIKLKRPGETEAGHAGKQPRRSRTAGRWAHRVDEVGSVRAAGLDAPAPRSDAETSSNDRPPCLENPRPDEIGAEHSSLPKTATLHFTLNQDMMACDVALAVTPPDVYLTVTFVSPWLVLAFAEVKVAPPPLALIVTVFVLTVHE